MLQYSVGASPDRVLEAISESTVPETAIGFAIRDRARGRLVGRVRADGSFTLRRARTLGSSPRVLVLAGRVQAKDMGSLVIGRYAMHPLLRIAIVVWILLFLAFSAVVIPGIAIHPELLWVPAVVGLFVVLMVAPFIWLASLDRKRLQADLETALRRAGPFTLLQARAPLIG